MRALSSAACTVHGSLQNLHIFFLGPRPAGLPATPPAPALLLRRAPQARPELGDCTLEGPLDLCSGTGCRVRARMLFKIFLYFPVPCLSWGFPGGSDSKESACNACMSLRFGSLIVIYLSVGLFILIYLQLSRFPASGYLSLSPRLQTFQCFFR